MTLIRYREFFQEGGVSTFTAGSFFNAGRESSAMEFEISASPLLSICTWVDFGYHLEDGPFKVIAFQPPQYLSYLDRITCWLFS